MIPLQYKQLSVETLLNYGEFTILAIVIGNLENLFVTVFYKQCVKQT